MKKFLSLLLALTMVLSLTVVPARAADASLSQTSAEISKGQRIELIATAPTDTVTVGVDQKKIAPGSSVTYNWSSSAPAVVSVAAKGVGFPEVGVVTGVAPSSEAVTITCKMTVTYIKTEEVKGDGGSVTTPATYDTVEISKTAAITVKDAIAANEVSKVTFNGRTYDNTNSGCTVYYLPSEESGTLADKTKWTITPSTSSTVTLSDVSYSNNKATLTLTRKAQGSNQDLTLRLEIPCVKATASGNVSVSAPALASGEKYRVGTELTLSVLDSSNKNSQNVRYVWSATKDGKALPSVTVSSANKWTPSAAGNYVLTRTVYEGSDEVGKQTSGTIEVKADNYRAAIVSPTRALSVTPNSSRILFALSFRDYSTNTTTGLPVSLANTDVTWTVSGGNAKFEENNSTTYTAKGFGIGSSVAEPGTAYAYLLPGSAAASTITVTASFTYNNKLYTVRFNNLSVVSMTAKLNATYYGAGSNYTSSSLAYYADSAIKSYSYAQLASGESVSSVLIDTIGMNSNGLGQFSNFSSASITFTPYVNSFGKATFTGTAVTNKNNRFAITFSIPVTPVPVNSFDSQTAEPISTSSVNTSYKVSAPSGYTKFYVLGNSSNLSTNQTIDYSQYSAAQLNSMGYTSSTLPSTYFGTSGQCTLYVIAWNDSTSYTSYSRYYCGPMTVTQTNYNIQYNGVAGENVQFAQSDFNDFMNKVAEARGDASKTKSYPYVTFDYVTFSLPTTAQGTLYYGGTAMSTSNSSGAFNTRTKVTNLDSVTFVPNAKTTAKTITLNFTLHATYYSSSSTSRGTERTYFGTVVVNLVREDIKYTVSQGDSVRFDESDFLNYLRSTKGYTSNYTIDYVTFDQSAVSAVNEGSLYTYYNGYNYGGSIKTTDKFYYSATASQNAISDVAFLASRYAKTGETVYIPFTIYARYGTTGTGTRQLTGTVAIKIGQTMNFIDVKTTDYFYDSVKWAVNKGVTTGTSSTTFSPYNPCKRAEIVTFLWRAAGSPEPTTTRNPFRDVNAVTHSSYYKAILWASQKGIAAGTSTTTFSPDQVCTRAQIVTFLYRYAGKPSGYYSNPFKDVSATNEASYYNAILWASGKGITTGSSPTTFSPYASCNRAEAVTFLYRYTNGL